MQVPAAVVGQSLAAAALPTLSRLHAEGRRSELDDTVLRTLQAGIGIAVLAGAACAALATPLVAMVYERGAFTAEDTRSVAPLLALFSLAVPAWVAQQIIVRSFYARGDTWRPMLLGTVVSILLLPLYYGMGQAFGAVGIASASALGMSLNALATLFLARQLHGAPPLGRLLSSAGRTLAIALLAAAAAMWVQAEQETWWQSLGLGPTVRALIELASGGLAFAAVAGLGVAFFGDEALRGSVTRLLRRVTRRFATS
jgi:putative peptidoglycan lipid II flippase